MEIHPDKPIGEIAVEVEGAIEYFEEKNINYCFGGRQTFSDACAQAGVGFEEASAWLGKRKLFETGTRALDWSDRSLSEIIDHLVTREHKFLRVRLATLSKRAAVLALTKGSSDPRYERLYGTIEDMASHMEQHMGNEESVVFPFLKGREAALARGEGGPNPFLDLPVPQHPLAVLSWKHEAMWDHWVALRELTNGLKPPPTADQDFVKLCQDLKEFEGYVHSHGHLEDNILFRKAIKLKFLD